MEANAGTLDLYDGNSDSYMISSIYKGMDEFDMVKNGANGFEADKFMVSNSTSYNYALNLDIRFEVGDEVDIFTFFKSSTGTVTGLQGLNRTLNAVGIASASIVLFCSGMLALF